MQAQEARQAVYAKFMPKQLKCMTLELLVIHLVKGDHVNTS